MTTQHEHQNIQQNQDDSDGPTLVEGVDYGVSFFSPEEEQEALQKVKERIAADPELKKKCRELLEEINSIRSYAIGYKKLSRNASKFIRNKCSYINEDGDIKIKQNMYKYAYAKAARDLIDYNELCRYHEGLLSELTHKFLGKMNSIKSEINEQYGSFDISDVDILADIIMDQPEGTSTIVRDILGWDNQW